MAVDTFPGCYFDGQLPEPRQRVGGVGTPAHEVFSYVPSFRLGIPSLWDSIDPNDPPMYESEADYLERHGRLSAQERRRKLDRSPEAVAINPRPQGSR